MTVGTAPLTPAQTWRKINALVAFLAANGVTHIAVTYGWGCHTDNIAQPVNVPLAELTTFLHKNIAQGISPGRR